MSTYRGGEIERMKRERVNREIQLKKNTIRTYHCPETGAKVKVLKPGYALGTHGGNALEEWQV